VVEDRGMFCCFVGGCCIRVLSYSEVPPLLSAISFRQGRWDSHIFMAGFGCVGGGCVFKTLGFICCGNVGIPAVFLLSFTFTLNVAT